MKMHPSRRAVVRDMVAETLSAKSGVSIGSKWKAFVDMVLTADEGVDLTQAEVFGIIFDDVPAMSGPRTETITPELVERCVSEVCTALEKLPRTYDVVVGMPGLRGEQHFEYRVSADVDVFVSDERWQSASTGGLFDVALMPGPCKTFIRVRLSGFYSRLSHTSTLLDQAWAKYRQLMYLLTVPGDLTHAPRLSTPRPECKVVDDLGRQFLCTPPARLADYMTGLVHYPNGMHPGLQLRKALDLSARFYAAPASDDRDRLTAAMEWLVDSEMATDHTMGYIAACIGIESLLGDDETNVETTRLQDRYSHLMGGTRSARRGLANELREVFKMRGQLIHARRTQRLRGRELAHLNNARQILRSCLEKELATFLA